MSSKVYPDRNGVTMKWLLNVIDPFTKYAWSRAMPNKEGETTQHYLAEMYEKWGEKPRMIQSDNGSEFKFIKPYLAKNGITQVFSLPHKPQSNGAIERFNATLKRMLAMNAMYAGENNWPEQLASILNSYNRTYQRVIKDSPERVLQKFYKVGEKALKQTKELLEKQMYMWS